MPETTLDYSLVSVLEVFYLPWFLCVSVTLWWIALIPIAHYLNFKVVNANKANTSEAIQNRTIIFDSDHPISSK